MALLLHVPVIHQGYLQLFKRRENEKTLYIIGEELIKEFPLLEHEIRRVSPPQVKKMIDCLKIFETVEVVTKKTLTKLEGQRLISADEDELKTLIEKYLPDSDVTYDHAFLRWDARNVRNQEVVNPDLVISHDKFKSLVMARAKRQASKSADWFRQVGAVLVKDRKILASSFNKRQPTPHAGYTEGDPRNFLALGEDTHLRNVLHAEQAVIAEAAKNGIKAQDADLYVTTFPCPDCAAVIAEAGIRRCFFSEGYFQLDGEKILKRAGVKIIKVGNEK